MHAPSSLDLDLHTMRRLGRRIADLVVEHLATLREQPVHKGLPHGPAMALVAAPPPERGVDFETLLATLRERVFPYAVREPHPGFVAYVPSCPTFPAVLGDWLATGFNFFAGVWPVASGPNALELVVLEWFRQWLGMPEGSGGLLTAGGSAATLTALIAARHAVVGDDPERLSRLAVYTSEQAHSSVMRGAWIAGVARSRVRLIETDDAFCLRTDLLAEAIARDRAAGLFPLAVIASAGTTNTGAVDPLHRAADLCAREGVWLHVDAAFAGFAALTERGKRALDGIARADSVTLDPHKWLFVPFECGCLLARSPSRLRAAFGIFPEYLRDVVGDDAEVNFSEYGEQLTRYSRALKVWLSVAYFGTAAIAEAIDRGIDLAGHAEQLVRNEGELEVLAPAQLGIFCFRARPRGLDDSVALDRLNERILARVNAAGRYFLSSTQLRGTFSLRVCPIGFRTTAADITDLVRAVVEASQRER